MRLYYAAGVYVGTQADAKRLDKDFTTVEVPTDKDGLMAFLNRHKIAALAVAAPSPTPIADREAPAIDSYAVAEEDIADLLGDPVTIPKPPMDAGSVLSRMDTPGIEQMVEAIAVSKGASLRRFAGAVAIRFAELAK